MDHTSEKRNYPDILSIIEYMVQVTFLLMNQEHHHALHYSGDNWISHLLEVQLTADLLGP